MPGDSTSNEPFSAIAASEVLRFVGTEPFWGGELKADTLTFTSPGNPQGVDIAVKRFGGRNGMGLSGTFDGQAVDMTITPGACSDGMSDRQFPFTVMLKLGGETRQGSPGLMHIRLQVMPSPDAAPFGRLVSVR